mmetsp:Transcript_46071/g.92110  ORF Transcript_46071/g.92110 Transcript_46071/m.92110 type:complete len:246 (+) Transcript_46071:166-903(+)
MASPFRRHIHVAFLLAAVAPCAPFVPLFQAPSQRSAGVLRLVCQERQGTPRTASTSRLQKKKDLERTPSVLGPNTTVEHSQTSSFQAWFSQNDDKAYMGIGTGKIRIGEVWGETATPEPSWNGFCGRGRRKRPPWWSKRKRMASWSRTPRSTHVWGEIQIGDLSAVPEQNQPSSLTDLRTDKGASHGKERHSAHAWREAPCMGEVRLLSAHQLAEKGVTSLPLFGNRRIFDLSSLKEQWEEESPQ